MSKTSIVDACVRQYTIDYAKMAERVPEPWSTKLSIKSKVEDPAAGTLMATLPWYHAYWNEDSPDYDRPDSGEYTRSEEYRSPEKVDEYLAEQGVETALLTGHQIKFLPAVMNPEFTAVIASAYNELLADLWLESSDRLKGGIVVPMNNPEAAVEEIEKYASHPDMVTVIFFGGTELPFGHRDYRPLFDAVAAAGLPITALTSENPVHRQLAMGLPKHYATYNTNAAQNHYVNLVSMLFQGLFDEYPDVDVVWAGEGIGWILQPMWRSSRYYRNLEPQVPTTLEKEPHEYIENNYVTTYPLPHLDSEMTARLIDMVGPQNVLYGSGYPHWNHDELDDPPEDLEEDARDQILHGNAREVYGI
jgi:predicted TIM-barrel fold metal-dependent hydrolase